MAKEIFNPLEHPICFEFPERLEVTAWAGHIPFAMFLVSALRPRILVELGVDRGVSYCAFCQAVKTLHTGTKCHGIDTWKGDEHAGELAEDVLPNLRNYHDTLYSGFSQLVQSTFEDAVGNFADGSIDLLHIDGFHSYDAVRHDHETWLPKMSERGVVIFHDTTVRHRDFGVWKFWREVRRKNPSFEFLHSHGLGVLAVGTQTPESLKFLFEAKGSEVDTIRDSFAELGERITAALPGPTSDEPAFVEEPRRSRIVSAYEVLKYEGLRSLLSKVFRRH